MKNLTFKPTDKIKFNTNDSYIDSLSTYLDKILKYWLENFKEKTLNLSKKSDDSLLITTDSNNRDSLNSLYNTLKPAANLKDIEIKEIINGYEVKWISQAKPEQEKSKETKKDAQLPAIAKSSSGENIIKGLFRPIAQSIAARLVSHYIPNENKQLIEEIERIKELLK
jgi:hypothetical protein